MSLDPIGYFFVIQTSEKNKPTFPDFVNEFWIKKQKTKQNNNNNKQNN